MSIAAFSVMLLNITFFLSCDQKNTLAGESAFYPQADTQKINETRPGAENLNEYLHLIRDKNIGLVVNQTSLVGEVHLLDTLLSLGVKVKRVYTPEHGFRGEASAGEHIQDSVDMATGIKIISLYGKKRKPTAEDLRDIDMMVFDIQDLGVRFYTYISTLGEIMEACAENDIPLIVLDRPNPNGHYIDGPVMKKGFESFVAKYPIPVVYGMTIGELGLMINGERWLGHDKDCDLIVVMCDNYTHRSKYELPVPPSPNIPDFTAVTLYPSLCFFEGTTVSIGRGTEMPFKHIGHPLLGEKFDYSFIPVTNRGAKNPPHESKVCFGIDFNDIDIDEFRQMEKLELRWLIDFYYLLKDKDGFFLSNNFIDRLAGTDSLRKMIIAGYNAEQIRETWEEELQDFRKIRKKYLLYDEFE